MIIGFVEVNGIHVKGIRRKDPLCVQIRGRFVMIGQLRLCLKRRHESLMYASIAGFLLGVTK